MKLNAEDFEDIRDDTDILIAEAIGYAEATKEIYPNIGYSTLVTSYVNNAIAMRIALALEKVNA